MNSHWHARLSLNPDPSDLPLSRQETGPTYENPELEAMHKEIESLVSEQNQLEMEIGQREEQVKGKTSEASTLQVGGGSHPLHRVGGKGWVG